MESSQVVGDGKNMMSVRAANHSWIALVRDGTEVSRESNGEPTTGFLVQPGEYLVRTDGELVSVDIGHQELQPRPGSVPPLRLTSDAPDVHHVDGVGELPTDGSTAATVTVNGSDSEEIFLRSTGGAILDAQSGNRIRSVRLTNGTASFRFIGDGSPRLVTIHAFSGDQTAELHLELVQPANGKSQ